MMSRKNNIMDQNTLNHMFFTPSLEIAQIT